MFSVEARTVGGQVTAVGSAGPFTVVIDRPVEAGGGGKLESVRVTVDGDFSGEPAVSGEIVYEVELAGSGDLQALAAHVDRIAEIPNSLRQGTPVRLGTVRIS